MVTALKIYNGCCEIKKKIRNDEKKKGKRKAQGNDGQSGTS
jgi:hypothetical protein